MHQYIRKCMLLSLTTIVAMHTLHAKAQSTCYGSTKKGKLIHGVKLPAHGKNFTNYSNKLHQMGRTYVHSQVHDVVVASYRQLAKAMPNKVYKYAETGFKHGGKFTPHKTHQNGLSVDFITPVTKNGKSVHLPTHASNRYGYDIEFNKKDSYQGYQIDYEAMAAHIVTLHQQSKRAGIGIWRVIFDPKLQPKLWQTKYGGYLKTHLRFSKKRSWVRHDDHYHVDFKVTCLKMP